MLKRIILLLIFCLLGCKNKTVELSSVEDLQVFNYIQKYRSIAETEKRSHGIPISIKLAQGILESKSGRSELAIKANNHFGIKCGKSGKGPKYYSFSNEWNRKKKSMLSRKSCFRSYASVDESYRAHSRVLKQERYKKLFELESRDYKNWALGIQILGYASDPEYAKKIISIIETYRLYELDKD